MPNSGCCVPLCSGRGGARFPKDPELSKAWVVAIRRDKWSPNANSVVCKAHFKSEDFLTVTQYGLVPMKAQLKKGVVPSVFIWTIPEAESSRKIKILQRRTTKVYKDPEVPTKLWIEGDFVEKEVEVGQANLIHNNPPSKSYGFRRKRKQLRSEQTEQSTKTESDVPSAVHKKESPTTSENARPSPASHSRVTTTQSIGLITSKTTEGAVPKESLAGKLVISNQKSTMPDPNALLRLLKLPPNIMFKINATNTKVLKPTTPATSTVKTAASKNTTPPVEPQGEVIIPEQTVNADSSLDYIKKEPESPENTEQEVLEPTVEMYSDSEEPIVTKNIKTEPVDDVECSLEEAKDLDFIGPSNPTMDMSFEVVEETEKEVKSEPLAGGNNIPVEAQPWKPMDHTYIRRSTRIRRKSVKI